jgi:hypothetical protein
MTNTVISVGPVTINLSPVLFQKTAREFLKCLDVFEEDVFSAVPFFLCCQAMELSLKAQHLEDETRSRLELKKSPYSHNLKQIYDALEGTRKCLLDDEYEVLCEANEIYHPDKGFQYLLVGDAATAYTRYPDLTQLKVIAEKIVQPEAPLPTG